MHSNTIGTHGQGKPGHSGQAISRLRALRLLIGPLLCLAWLCCADRAHALTASAVSVYTYSCSASPQPASSFSTAAPLADDGVVGDTSTGYTASYVACVLWDMGANVSLGGVRAQFTNAYGNGVTAYYSTDGNTWTALGTLNSGTETTFGATTARYVQFVLSGNSISVTDTRVYDGSGNLMLNPGAAAPSAPTGLTATAGYSAVGLSWTAPSGAGLTYSVYRGTSSGGESTTALAGGLTATSYTDTSVTNGTAYYYTVKAVNAVGTSPASNEAHAAPQATAPPTPTGLIAKGGNVQVGLSWSAGGTFPIGSGSSGYNVYRGTSSGGESATPLASGVPGTTYTDTSVTNGTAYYYTVRAQDAAGTSAASNEAGATPAVPPALTASAVTIYNYGCSLSPQPASSFSMAAPLVYDGSVGDTTTGYTESYMAFVLWDMGTNVSLGGVRAQFTNAGNGASAYYSTDGNTWTALGGLTNGAELTFSATTARYVQFVLGGSSVSVTDTRLYDAYGNTVLGSGSAAPTNLKATPGNASVSLSWTAPAGTITGYNVYRAASGGSYAKINTSPVASTSYTDSGLTNGTTYYYYVTALSSSGESASSNVAPATPTASGGFGLAALSLYPTTVIGAQTNGTQSVGTITLSAPAPNGGIVVSLASSNTSLVTLPATVNVPAGSSSQTFTITASNVTSQTTVQISALYNGTTLSQTLTINPWLLSFQVSQTTLVGGVTPPATGTITLNAPAPVGGLPVAVSSSDPSVTVPATVTVPAGSTTTTFTLTTSAVPSGRSVTVTLSYSAMSLTQYLYVEPLLSSLSLNPYSVTGGTSATGTVSLNAAAPSGGVTVTLSNANTAVATVPSSVSVPAGSTSANFTVTTVPVTAVSSAAISASYGGASSSQTLMVNPITLSLALNPGSVVGGAASTGTITLNGTAPAGGLIVTLSSSNTGAATVPASVTVPAGQSSVTFAVTTLAVSSSTYTYVTASYGGLYSQAYLQVLPLLSSVSINPSTVIGGATATGTVSLNGPAPAGGASVALSSNVSGVTVPTTVLVPAGSTSVTFTVTTSTVTSAVSTAITASYAGCSRQGYLYVEPLLSSLYLNPYSVAGGTPSTGTVTLNAAQTGAVAVALSSSNTAVATVPATVTVPAGSTSATFTVTTLAVSTSASAVISGVYAGVTVSQTLSVIPLLASISVSPGTVIGGATATGTVTLNAPAPTAVTVTLSSSNTAVAGTPASVNVPAGSTSAAFTVTTSTVTASSTATLSASYGGVTRTTTLTVVPLISSVSVYPSQVVGGDPSTGTVYFSVQAPAGVSLTLSSSNTAAATVPTTLSVTPGSYSASFNVPTSAVSTATSVTITVSYGGVSKTAVLSVLPMPTVTGVVLTPAEVTGGVGTTGRVTLSGIAPAAGSVVALTIANTAIGTVPASVTVTSGQTQASFSVGTTPVAATTSTTITAGYRSTSASGPLIVDRPNFVGFTFAQNPTVGGSTDVATLQLNGVAPAGGVTIALSCVTPGSGLTGAAFPASVTIPAGATSVTVPVQTSTINTPVTLTFTATDTVPGGEVLTATLGLTVATLHATDLLPQDILLQWNVSAVGNFLLYRNGSLIATLPNTTTSYTDVFNWTSGQTYLYTIYDSNTNPATLLSTEQAVPYLIPASQDQAVDSRLDPRYATNVFVDHQFGSTAYKGGLFVGFASDPARVGRSFAEFNLNQSPPGGVYRTGRVNAYFITGDPRLGAYGVTVGCQTIPNNAWSAPTLTWDTAPTSAGFSPAAATQTVGVSYDPTVPGDVTASGGSGQVSLSWAPPTPTPVKTVATYTVSYGPYAGDYTQSVTGITGTSTTVTGLTNGQTYYFTIQAIYTDGSTSNSAPPVSVSPPSALGANLWCSWPLNADILAALQGTGGSNLYSVAWASTNEGQQGWVYFAKTEYQAALGPNVTHLWSLPTLLRLQVPPSVSISGTATGTLTVNAIGLMGNAVVTLSSSNTAVATVPASITVTGLNRTFNITPHAAGTATITASLGSISLSQQITVTNP